jgi:hypothetical protein
VARRFIEGLEWDMREDHRETDDRTGELRDEDSSRVVSTARVHVPEIFVRHRSFSLGRRAVARDILPPAACHPTPVNARPICVMEKLVSWFGAPSVLAGAAVLLFHAAAAPSIP